jgi:Domain of unknown function (DUF2017)
VSAPIRRRRDGRYTVRLDGNVRTVLASLAQQLGPAVEQHDPMTRRLFPPAYPGSVDHEAEQAYRDLVDTALVNHHRDALRVLVETSGAETLSESELHAWLSGVESLRLVLGTRLDVSEDMTPPSPDDPSAAEYGLYEFMGELQQLIVETLAADLPDDGREDAIGGL